MSENNNNNHNNNDDSNGDNKDKRSLLRTYPSQQRLHSIQETPTTTTTTPRRKSPRAASSPTSVVVPPEQRHPRTLYAQDLERQQHQQQKQQQKQQQTQKKKEPPQLFQEARSMDKNDTDTMQWKQSAARSTPPRSLSSSSHHNSDQAVAQDLAQREHQEHHHLQREKATAASFEQTVGAAVVTPRRRSNFASSSATQDPKSATTTSTSASQTIQSQALEKQQAKLSSSAGVAARSSRYTVRGAAAETQTRRSLAKTKTQRQLNCSNEEGPSLAAAQEGPSLAAARGTTASTSLKSLFSEMDWTAIDTDHMMVPPTTMVRSTSAPVSTADLNSNNKSQPGAFASNQPDAALGKKKEQEQAWGMEQEEEAGPTLAPARAVSSQVILPPGTTTGDAELATATATAITPDRHGDWSFGVSATPALALESAQAHLTETSNQDMLEATAGIAVRPGAFAVQGMDAHNNNDSQDSLQYDEDFLEHDPENPIAENGVLSQDFLVATADGDTHDGDQAEGLAVVAELYERELVECNIVQEDEFETNPKVLRRLRMVQVLVACFSVTGIICVIISAVTGFGQGQDLVPLGPVISGWSLVTESPTFGPRAILEQDLVLMGHSVAISQDGTRIVTAAPGAGGDSGNDLNVGEVYVMEQGPFLNENATVVDSWQVIHTLPGLGANENPIASLSTSIDTSIVAVGYPFLENKGRVQVFEEAVGWATPPVVLSAEDLQISNSNNRDAAIAATDATLTGFGYSVALSSDASLLAVGAPLYEAQALSVTGFVRVYQRQPGAEGERSKWQRMGSQDIIGTHANELFGWSVSLRGGRLAVGGPAHDIDRGVVRVLEFSPAQNEWIQVGEDLVGSNPLQRFGESVSLSEDGTVLAVGARGTAFDPGQVQVFYWMDNAWQPDNRIWTGQAPGDGLGASVDLSLDGQTLAMGAPENDEFGVGSGHVQVWTLNADNGGWTQEGSNIGGTKGSHLGTSVALATSAPELRVVGGAPGADYDGTVSQTGSLVVYDRSLETETT